MRELHVIEDEGVFGITFKSDNKEEANTVMRAIQRFISKVSKKEIKENIDDNSKSSEKDYSRCPIDGPSKGVYLNLFSNDKLIELYNNDELEQGYKDYIKNELNSRGIFDLSMTKSENNETSKKIELENKIKAITNGRAYNELTDEELEKIIPLDKELSAFYNTTETAKHILQGRKFNHSRELENKITQGRRLSELTLEELKELEKVTMLEHYRKDIRKEIDKRENKYFEETLEEDNGIISFGEDDSNYRIDEEDEEDPLSVDTDNINNWDFDADGDKVDSEGNKMLFDY
ncbi:hypothetical protein [Brachyspira alvinipulli]|uniref:hypothetical protein n=1 Tax=Brachyspira alvinipulli TaxID=84379 RepID=UPI000481EACE|nr:hypothetical protein [Brachyspira alvinipulli]